MFLLVAGSLLLSHPWRLLHVNEEEKREDRREDRKEDRGGCFEAVFRGIEVYATKYTKYIRDEILNINRRIKLSYCGLYWIVNVDSGRGKILWVSKRVARVFTKLLKIIGKVKTKFLWLPPFVYRMLHGIKIQF